MCSIIGVNNPTIEYGRLTGPPIHNSLIGLHDQAVI